MSDIVEKFTTHLKNVLTRALVLVAETGSDTISPEHLLWGVATESGSVGAEILRKSGVDAEALRELVNVQAAVVSESASATDALPRLSEASKRVIEKAVLTATVYEHRYVGTEHLVAGILQVSSPPIAAFLKRGKINVDDIRNQLGLIMKGTKAFPQLAGIPSDDARPDTESDSHRHEHDLDEDFAHSNVPTLEYFATELTTGDAATRIDPVIGRDGEIDRTIEILSRRTKNNPILVGDPGVGKTAIVEGLARRIVEGKVPSALLNKRVFSIDLGSIVAGTMYRGEFEGRMKQMIDEVREQPDIILFVDEVHMVMGAGSASGSLDAANMLKPALARGWIRCIGATTPSEYKKTIESDGALERRFQMIHVDEPSEEEALQILRGLASRYEEHHHVSIPDDTLRFAVQASIKHIHTNALPDKAIDLIDEASAMLRVASMTDDGGWRGLVNDLRALRDQKRTAIVEERYLDASMHKQEEDDIEEQIKEARANEQQAHYGTVTREMIAKVIERKTGARVSAAAAQERLALASLSDRLKSALFGQDEAVDRVAAAVRRSALGIHESTRPLGSFLFVGPSGTGKSELARQLALHVLHSEKALIRLDMSEYAESYSVSKLIGSPAGYVGYRDTARLTDAIKQRPSTVVLFDEIEKAHTDVHNLLLQILEHGELTDATGRTVSFRQAFIVLTSNVGAELFENGAMGFQASDTLDVDSIHTTLKERFRPELLNRLDHIQVFQPLDNASLKRIAQGELSVLKEQLKRQDVDLKWKASVVSHLLGSADGRRQNARHVKQRVQTKITDLVADYLVSHPTHTRLSLSINKNAIDLSSISR